MNKKILTFTQIPNHMDSYWNDWTLGMTCGKKNIYIVATSEQLIPTTY